jgi:hypothetical protein
MVLAAPAARQRGDQDGRRAVLPAGAARLLDRLLFRCSGCPAQAESARAGDCLRLPRGAEDCRRCRRRCQSTFRFEGEESTSRYDSPLHVSTLDSLGSIFVPKPSTDADCQRRSTSDLGWGVRGRPLASAAIGGDCYSLGDSIAREPMS